MNIWTFLLVVFAGFAGLGAFLAWRRWWRAYALIMMGLLGLGLYSFLVAARPQTDDPYPALMLFVVGLSGGLSAGAGMVAGPVALRLFRRRTGRGKHSG